MKAYPRCKPSGVEWLGDVPEGWEVKRLRRAVTLNPSKSELGPLPEGTEVSFLPMEAVGENGEIDLSRTRPVTEVETGYTYFRDGDMTFAKITPCFENGKRALMRSLLGGIGFGTTELTVLRARPEAVLPDYLFWIVSAPEFRSLGEAHMYGAGGQKRVPDDFVREFSTALPPLPEQQAIAGFLDVEVGKIDDFVEQQRQLIALLAEKRQAVISHAVTQGLNPEAPRKPSGLDWLGDIPEGWDVVPLKHLVSHVVDCLHTTPHYDGEVVYPAVRTADVEPGKLLVDQIRLVSREVYLERIQRLRPEPNDIVYSREGERLGMAALVPFGIQLCLGQRMMMFRCKPEQNPRFIMWALNSQSIYQQVVEKNLGSTSPHVNISDVINFRMAIPDVPTQRSVADHIDAQTAQLDALTATAEAAIALLQERRAALISAAVTGKIDVRDRAPQPQ